MGLTIHPVHLGISCCYVIQGKGTIMIDGGSPGKAARFRKALKTLAIDPRSIRLLVLTHGHWDHIGSAKDIQEITGAKIALHRREKDCLEKSLKFLSPAVTTWAHIINAITKMFLPLIHIPATTVDVVLGDQEFSLSDYGIPGKIIYTPGHSMGSVSVLLETGDAFLGDLAIGRYPVQISKGLPIFAEDMQKARESWQLLLNEGAKMVYPAHGKSFPAEVMHQIVLVGQRHFSLGR